MGPGRPSAPLLLLLLLRKSGPWHPWAPPLHAAAAERAHRCTRPLPHGPQAPKTASHRASAVVDDGAADHDGDAHALVAEELVQRKDGGLGVERVKDGLHQEQVHAALVQRLGLVVVGAHHLVVRDAAERRVLHARGHAQRLVGGANGARHKARPGARVLAQKAGHRRLGHLGSRLVDGRHLLLRRARAARTATSTRRSRLPGHCTTVTATCRTAGGSCVHTSTYLRTTPTTSPARRTLACSS